MSPPLVVDLDPRGALLHCTLNRPKGNILDREMVAALRAAVRANMGPEVRGILISGEGAHFSFGASVEEHRAEQVAGMLPEFHALFRELADSGRVLMAAVRGQCLGGGLELAAFCHRVFASPEAKFGSPEIRLGVFAPVASVVLPRRIGQPAADDLLLTGRSIDAAEALRLRLIDEISDQPVAAALAWFDEHIFTRSGAVIPIAVSAARRALHAEIHSTLAELEALYLGKLMATHDAREGIESFLARRTPVWRNA